MKCFSLILCLFCVSFAQVYRVKDSRGKLILETKDLEFVCQMQNVRIDTLKDTTKIYSLKDTSVTDALKDQLLETLKAPKKSSWNYQLEWATPNGGTIILVKGQKMRPIMFCDFNGRTWMDKNFPGFLESQK